MNCTHICVSMMTSFLPPLSHNKPPPKYVALQSLLVLLPAAVPLQTLQIETGFYPRENTALGDKK